ncbi:hypothetical protein H4R99_007008 [Coemansia sp. RSA 1722]|nr:hypothetical protein LPJ57_000683 [Coemansia sp. RSA 486]KAJ2235617.1 hypothetical protein IWW45_002465 [Coemansia sp. RSA 485]KAJ2590704.1 hypothetical protein H4R99_007008 [Coemansia sp. RSA 1722]
MKSIKYLFALLAYSPILASAGDLGQSVRVYGGQPATASPNLSFVADVVSLDPVHRGKKCTGALITNTTILTTANCLVSNSQTWYNPHLVSVSFNGAKDKYMAENTITASGFHLGMFNDNIGLITLASAVAPEIAKPVGVYFGPPAESLEVYSLGYGRINDTLTGISPKTPQIVQMQLMPGTRCMGYAKYDANTQICAGAKKDTGGLCAGDEGAPLITKIKGAEKYALVGVASFRARQAGGQDDEKCGQINNGLVYYEAGAPWAAWISQMTGVAAETLLVAGAQSEISGGLNNTASDWYLHVSAQSGAVHGSNSSSNSLEMDGADSENSSHSAAWARNPFSLWPLVLCSIAVAAVLA